MKYLKLFDAFVFDNEEDNKKDREYELLNDPVIAALYEKMNIDYLDEYDFANAAYIYRHDYNDDNPYIHYLNNVLEKLEFKASPMLNSYEDLDDTAKLIYDEMEHIDIYNAIMYCNQRDKVVEYLKNDYPSFYEEYKLNVLQSGDLSIFTSVNNTEKDAFKNKLTTDQIDSASNMQKSGF